MSAALLELIKRVEQQGSAEEAIAKAEEAYCIKTHKIT